jgi:hypothetical protein
VVAAGLFTVLLGRLSREGEQSAVVEPSTSGAPEG